MSGKYRNLSELTDYSLDDIAIKVHVNDESGREPYDSDNEAPLEHYKEHDDSVALELEEVVVQSIPYSQQTEQASRFTNLPTELKLNIISQLSIASFLNFIQVSKSNYEFCYKNLYTLPLKFTAAKLWLHQRNIHIKIRSGVSKKQAELNAKSTFQKISTEEPEHKIDNAFYLLKHCISEQKAEIRKIVEENSSTLLPQPGNIIDKKFMKLMMTELRSENQLNLHNMKLLLSDIKKNKSEILRLADNRKQDIETLISQIESASDLEFRSFNRLRCCFTGTWYLIINLMILALGSYMFAVLIAIILRAQIGPGVECKHLIDRSEITRCLNSHLDFTFGVLAPIIALTILPIPLLCTLYCIINAAYHNGRQMRSEPYPDANIIYLNAEHRQKLISILSGADDFDLDRYFINNNIIYIKDIKTKLELFLNRTANHSSNIHDLPLINFIELLNNKIQELSDIIKNQNTIDCASPPWPKDNNEFSEICEIARKRLKDLTVRSERSPHPRMIQAVVQTPSSTSRIVDIVDIESGRPKSYGTM